MNPTMTKFLV